MASSYMDELTCPVCLSIFTDPVSLSCGHSFCRHCVFKCLGSQNVCPSCRTDIPTAERNPSTNHTLKNLAEKAKEDKKNKETGGVCLEHEEKLKLFCETDQQLVCVICRDEEKHGGHRFKPVKDAAKSTRQVFKKTFESLSADNIAIENLTKGQKEEIDKTREKSCKLMTQISTQFDEMHQFLRGREEVIKRELQEKEKRALAEMEENLEGMRQVLSTGKEKEEQMRCAGGVPEPEGFLQQWSKIREPFLCSAGGLKVVPGALSLGSYESHLQFFIWKEMLQVIQPLPERLTLQTEETGLTISHDKRAVFCTPIPTITHIPGIPDSRFSGSHGGFSFSSSGMYGNTFGSYGNATSGIQCSYSYSLSAADRSRPESFDQMQAEGLSAGLQQYWEVEVGAGAFWALGVKGKHVTCLTYEAEAYHISHRNSITGLTVEDKPRKIGVYLNPVSSELSFYNADDMRLIHTIADDMKGVSAYFSIGSCEGMDIDPLTVCWY